MAARRLAAALGSPIAAYRCANKKADGYAVYTNMVPGGGFRGYGASQTTFAIECAIDDLARLLDMNPFEIRRKNKVRETDRIESIWKDPSDVDVRQLRARPMPRSRRDGAEKRPGIAQARGRRLARGDRRRRLRCSNSGPPTEHRSGAEMTLLADGTYHLAVGSTEMGNGSVTSHRQLAASVLDTRAGNIAIINADTDRTPYDTGTFASTGTVVAGQAVEKTAKAHARQHPRAMQAAMPAAMSRTAGWRTMPLSAPTARFRWPSSMRQEPRWAIAST